MAYLTKRSVSISDPRAAEYLSDTTTSNRVTRGSVFQIPSFLHAVRLTSSAIARTDCNVYRELRDGGRTIDDNHPAQELLTYKANPYQSYFVFIQGLTANALIGDGYALIDRDELSNPIALYLLDPQSVYPVQEFERGRLINAYYGISTNVGQIAVAGDDVIHIRNLSYGTGLAGVDLITDSSVSLSRAQSVQQFSSRYFDNSSHIDRFLKLPGWLSVEQSEQLRESLGYLHKGTSNVGRLAILQGGSELGSLPLNAEQSQLTQSQEQTIIDMGNLLGVVQSKLGARNSISYGSLSEDNRAYLSDVLDYYLTSLESEFTVKLLRYRERRFIEFDRESLFTSDPDYADSLIRQFQGKALAWEELRSKLKRTTDTDGLTFGAIPGEQPAEPQNAPVATDLPQQDQPAQDNQQAQARAYKPSDFMPVNNPNVKLFDTYEAAKAQARAYKLSLAALERIKTRLQRSLKSDPDLAKHHEVIATALPDDYEAVIDDLARYQQELNHALPEQREGIIEQWDIHKLNQSIWK